MDINNINFIPELYNLIKKGATDYELADYIAKKGIRYGNQLLSNTFRRAGRVDNITQKLGETDISVGDTIKSRMTARIGKVFGVRSDGRTIEVQWETGGKQALSKESVFKLRSKSNETNVEKVNYDGDKNYAEFDKVKKQK